jgi:hypothetical protein
MRIGNAILFGTMALAILTAPALAKHSDAQKTDNKSTPSPCHAYERAADGSAMQLPCEELGSKGQTQQKSATRGADQETH